MTPSQHALTIAREATHRALAAETGAPLGPVTDPWGGMWTPDAAQREHDRRKLAEFWNGIGGRPVMEAECGDD